MNLRNRIGEIGRVYYAGKKVFRCFISPGIMFTSAPVALQSETPEPSTGTSFALSDLAVPEEIGKVQERFAGKSPRTIIQIQDVHAHATAQQNIAAILGSVEASLR